MRAKKVTYNGRTYFASRAEADAFAMGVEFVNDSSLTVKGIECVQGKTRERFYVLTLDGDNRSENPWVTRRVVLCDI